MITKEIKINELIEKYPEVIPVLMGYGLQCIGCAFSDMDTLEQGANLHGFDKETMKMMLKDVNSVVEGGETIK